MTRHHSRGIPQSSAGSFGIGAYGRKNLNGTSGTLVSEAPSSGRPARHPFPHLECPWFRTLHLVDALELRFTDGFPCSISFPFLFLLSNGHAHYDFDFHSMASYIVNHASRPASGEVVSGMGTTRETGEASVVVVVEENTERLVRVPIDTLGNWATQAVLMRETELLFLVFLHLVRLVGNFDICTRRIEAGLSVGNHSFDPLPLSRALGSSHAWSFTVYRFPLA